MPSALVFALLSMVFAGLNDVIFKKFTLRPRSRGTYIAGIGVVWGLLTFAWQWSRGAEGQWSADTVGYGAGGGMMLAMGNLLLVESLSRIPVSLGATIYRLNTIGVVLFAIAFLGERLSWLEATGIAAGVLAVLLLGGESGALRSVAVPVGAMMVAIAASLLRAGFVLVSKAGVSAGADGGRMLLVTASMFIVVGIAYALLRERGHRIARERPVYPVVSGIVIFMVATTLVEALKRADATVVAPIANLSFTVSLLLSAALGLERLTSRKLAAVVLAGASLWLLSRSTSIA
jgi:drug/metabolite transporter (DMT)-like permease